MIHQPQNSYFYFYSTLATHFQGYPKLSHHQRLLYHGHFKSQYAIPWSPLFFDELTPSIFSLLLDSPLFLPCPTGTPGYIIWSSTFDWNPSSFLIFNLTQNQCYEFTFFIPTPKWLSTNRAKSWEIHYRDPCLWESWLSLILTPFSRCRTWIRLSQSGYCYSLTTVIGSGTSTWSEAI